MEDVLAPGSEDPNDPKDQEVLQEWPRPQPPLCSAVDCTSLLLEWPEYAGFGEFLYSLQMGLVKKVNRGGSRKNAEAGAARVENFHVAGSEYFPDGFLASRAGGSGHCFESAQNLDWIPVYSGIENSGKIQDLLPGMGYIFRLCILPKLLTIQSVAPPPSQELIFFTVPSPPCPPEAPILVDRGRTSLKLKWSPPVITGGMQISGYYVEMKEEASGQCFESVYAGASLTAKVTRLAPGASYVFRIKASNCLGCSNFSKEITHHTAPSVPAAPAPPKLLSSSSTSITVCWEEPENHGSPISLYTLETDDGMGGPFLVAYTGDKRSCEVSNLRSGRIYKVRVLAHNDVGKGAFSLPATISTMYSPPAAPSSLSIHGRTATSAVVSWNPPESDGGSPVTGYELDFTSTNKSKWIQAYVGELNAHTLVGLCPGFHYRIRVRARNEVGAGAFSKEASLTTLPGPPDAPSCPRLLEAECSSVKVCWDQPDHDGGSALLGYRLEMWNTESEMLSADPICVYKGLDLFTVIHGLTPGQTYVCRVQALNKSGSSGWSSSSEIKTKAAAPEAPEAPMLVSSSSTFISLRWSSPSTNGGVVTSYRLRMAILGYSVKQQTEMLRLCFLDGDYYVVEKKNSEDPDVKQDICFTITGIYDGPAAGFTVKNLQPYTSYAFCLQAFNSIGGSEHSPISVFMTSPSSPLPPAPPIIDSTSYSMVLQWKLPERDNGARVNSFNLEMKAEGTISRKHFAKGKKAHGEPSGTWTQVYSGPILTYEISSLLPGHSYAFRLIAYNEYGASTPAEFTATTLAASPLPPDRPLFSGLSPTSIRVRWSAPACNNGASVLRYKLLMDYSKPNQLQKVYEGEATSYKVVKLIPGRSYQAAVQAINQAGASELSELVTITLPQMSLPSLDAPKLESISNNVLFISWKELKVAECISYTLQMESAGKLVQVYEGATPSFSINLAAGRSYKFRVRANGEGDIGPGPWSPFSAWTSDALKPLKKAEETRYQASGNSNILLTTIYETFAQPWSLRVRRILAMSGIAITLTCASLLN